MHVIPNVLAARYASPELVALWSPEHKIVLERRLWIAVLRAQRDLGRRRPRAGDRRLRAGGRAGRPGVDRRARAGHPPRRQGAHRGVQRARRPRARAQGHDQPRPHRERRAAADPAVAGAGPRPHGRRARPARPPGRRARRAGDGRAQPQRRGAGHHARQAVRDRGRRAARGVRAAGGPARALPAARDQGPGRHGPGHARPARRRRGASSRRWSERVAAHLGLRRRVHQRRPGLPALAGLRRASARCVQLAAAPSSLATDDPADGRRRAGHRGLPARPGRLVGDAAQDERPLGRADQRPAGAAARLRRDGGRAGRGAVERGRRVRLGGAPRRPARRVLRPRRAVRDRR